MNMESKDENTEFPSTDLEKTLIERWLKVEKCPEKYLSSESLSRLKVIQQAVTHRQVPKD